jgi:hypothetical protein
MASERECDFSGGDTGPSGAGYFGRQVHSETGAPADLVTPGAYAQRALAGGSTWSNESFLGKATGDAGQRPIQHTGQLFREEYGEDHLISSTMAACHVACAVVGLGILTLPLGLVETGWSGLGLMFITCAICAYSSTTLIDCVAHVQMQNQKQGRSFTAAKHLSRYSSYASNRGETSAESTYSTMSRATNATNVASPCRPTTEGQCAHDSMASNTTSTSLLDRERDQIRKHRPPTTFAERIDFAMVTYGEVGEFTFGPWGRRLVDWSVHLYLGGTCFGFLILTGGSVKNFLCEKVSYGTAIVGSAVLIWPHVLKSKIHESNPLSIFNFLVAVWLVIVVLYEAVTLQGANKVGDACGWVWWVWVCGVCGVCGGCGCVVCVVSVDECCEK